MNDNLPAHLAANEHRLFLLRRVANWAAGFFGGPVYLCGSALRDDNANPRDWDLRCVVPDAEFTARWGRGDQRYAERWASERGCGTFSKQAWQWCDDMRHQSYLYTRNAEVMVDFQAYPASYCEKFAGKPRFRLDTRDDPDAPAVGLSGEGERG